MTKPVRSIKIKAMLTPYLTTLHGVLYQADCLELMGSLNSEIVDCIFADPPFNLGKDYKNKYNDKISGEEYYDWCYQWLRECCRLLRPGELVCLCFTGYSH